MSMDSSFYGFMDYRKKSVEKVYKNHFYKKFIYS